MQATQCARLMVVEGIVLMKSTSAELQFICGDNSNKEVVQKKLKK